MQALGPWISKMLLSSTGWSGSSDDSSRTATVYLCRSLDSLLMGGQRGSA